jgi:aminoglycoside phosphotransferase (APT) family kinase protein
LPRERNAEFVADATELLTNLARMHARWWGGDSIPDTSYMVDIETSHFGNVLDDHATNLAKLMPIFEKLFSKEQIENLERISGYRSVFAAAAEKMPRTFCHGDFHAQNILWNPEPQESNSPRAWVLDWQMVTVGPGAMDVATYLAIAVPKRHTDQLLMPLIEVYHRGLLGNGVQGYSIEQLIHDYRYTALATLGVMVFALGGLMFAETSLEMIVEEVLGNAIAGVESVEAFDLLR